VDEAAGDAHHGRTAVLALSVQLEGLRLGVVVAHPRDAGDVVVALVALGEREEGGLAAGAGLLHAAEEHDLEPARGGDGLERGEEASRGSKALLGRDAGASLNGDDVEETKHGRAAVLDLHGLVALHVTGLDEAERVVDTQGREHAKVALREHGEGHRAGGGLEGRGLEGLDGLEERNERV